MKERLRIALLTMENPSEEAVKGETPLVEVLKDSGHIVDWVVWNESPDWNNYDFAIIRTTWDYQQSFQDFVAALSAIDKSTCRLLNPLEVVKWNIDKNYLFELEQKGVSIVPTKKLKEVSLEQAFDVFSCEEVVVKPSISASAHDTYLISRNDISRVNREIELLRQKKEMFIQPKIKEIVSEGEFSVHYFAGELSHTVLKKPKAGDFRSQEEYGSLIKKVETETSLRKTCESILKTLPFKDDLLYARLDFVRGNADFLLMELELIEPCLYFNYDDKAPGAFLKALLSA